MNLTNKEIRGNYEALWRKKGELETKLATRDAQFKALGEILLRAIRAEEMKSVHFRASWLSSARELVTILNIPRPEPEATNET